MLSSGKVIMYVGALVCMIVMGIYIMQLRGNLAILEKENQTVTSLIELKNVALARAEYNLSLMGKLIKEQEEDLQKAEEKLDNAKKLLERIDKDYMLDDDSLNMLYSLGILRKNGSENGDSHGVQSDITAGGICPAQGSTDNDGQDVQRPSPMDD